QGSCTLNFCKILWKHHAAFKLSGTFIGTLRKVDDSATHPELFPVFAAVFLRRFEIGWKCSILFCEPYREFKNIRRRLQHETMISAFGKCSLGPGYANEIFCGIYRPRDDSIVSSGFQFR